MSTRHTGVDDVGDMGTSDGSADDAGTADAVTRVPVVQVLLQVLHAVVMQVPVMCWL